MSQRPVGRPSRARPRILASAQRLLLEQGLEVSLEAIAQDAGVTRQTLYNHYPGKAVLLLAAFESLRDQLPEPDLELADGTQLAACLERLAEAVQAHFHAPRTLALHRLLVVASQQMPELAGALRQRASGKLSQRLAALLEGQAACGRLRIEQPQAAARAFLGALMGASYPAALLGAEPPDAEALAQLRHEVCRSFLRAWSPG